VVYWGNEVSAQPRSERKVPGIRLEENAVIGFSFFKDKISWLHHWELKTIASVKKRYQIIGPIAFINQKMVDDLNKYLNHTQQHP